MPVPKPGMEPMSTREQFGDYLLLKKLSEDPLGETFRAGMLGPKGMERVVLLRVFNGQGVDGQVLWESTQERSEIQRALRGPNLGEGIEMGEIQGIPFVAYDYISGKNLATLFGQATRTRSPIPTEHALLIAERVALGCALAAENRFGNDRIHHGFLVPHLVMISNEGESRVLGFEVAPGLRRFINNPALRQHFARYLAPEALAGQPPEQSDDIYSLGAMLFELLTARALPAPTPEGYAGLLAQATGSEGRPLPDALKHLLGQSLVPRAERLQDVAAWHKTLNAWMFEGQYNPTTFNLAFFMHNLFRQDIERESQELEVEKTMPVPVVTTPPPSAPDRPTPTPQAVVAPEPPPQAVAQDAPVEEPASEGSSKLPLWIALAALLLVGVGGAWWWSQRSTGPSTATDVVATQQAVGPGEGVDVAGMDANAEPVLTPEEEAKLREEEQLRLQQQIDSMVEQKATDMESQLRAQMDGQLDDLRKQLTDAQTAASDREEQLRQQKADEERKRLEAEAAKPPPPPAVRRGDLVTPGPGVVGPKLIRMPAPRFPAMGRRLNKSGVDVPVQVLVDENGRVTEAKLVNDKVGFGFDAEALSAARGAVYEPARANKVPVKMWATLRIKFE